MSHLLNRYVQDEFTLFMACSYFIRQTGSNFTVNLLAYHSTV